MRRTLFGLAAAGGVVGMAAAALWIATSGSTPEPPPARPSSVERLRGPPVQRPAAPAGAPHVVLLLGCTLRRDQVGVYGGPAGLTPWIDGLAAQGVWVTDPIAAAPWTRPAAAALLTGRHALELGMAEPGPARGEWALPPAVDTLAERMRDAGWTTVGATANPNLNSVFGFDQGFDLYIQPRELWRDHAQRLGAPRLQAALLDALDARPDPERPVFVQVMLVDAHAPFPSLAAAGGPVEGLPDDLVRYRAGLAQLDGALASLTEALAQRLDPARTLIVLASDHGEGLRWPAHHGKSHGRLLHAGVVDGVWIAAGPGLPAGVPVSGLASQVDLLPTVLGLVGLSDRAAGDPDDGQDLSAAFRSGGPTGRQRAYSDTWYAQADAASVRTNHATCIVDRLRGRRDCYDRIADPWEAVPVDDPGSLLPQVEAWRASRLERSLAPVRAAIGDAVEGQLKALGYVE